MKNSSFHLVVYSPALIFWLIFQVIFFWPKLLGWSLLVIILINLFNVYLLPGWQKPIWPRYLLVIVPTIFSLSSLVFTSLLVNRLTIQILILISTFIIYQYWRLVFHRLSPKPINQNILDLFSSRSFDYIFIGVALYVNFLALFLSSASLFAVKSFLSLGFFPVLFLLAIAVFSLTLAAANVSGLFERPDQRFFWLVVAWAIWQLGVIFFFLPFNYSVSGLLLSIIFYAAINLTRFSLSGELKGRRLKWFIAFPAIASLIILLSARWL